MEPMFEDPQILGKLYGYLITHRILRTRVGENEKFHPGEKELAQAYKSMDKHSKIAFEEFLLGSGFKLVRYDAFSYPGLPQGSTCYVLIRNSMENVPQWLKPSNIYDAVVARKGHKSNTQRVLRLWFFFIWLNMLALLYKGNRPLSAVSDAGRMSFTEDLLIKQISDFIELEIRQKEDADEYDQFMREVLLTDNPRDLRKRVSGFLEFMTRISYLGRYRFEEQTVYTQTLVMASEIASNYSDCFAYLANEFGEGTQVDEFGESGQVEAMPHGKDRMVEKDLPVGETKGAKNMEESGDSEGSEDAGEAENVGDMFGIRQELKHRFFSDSP